MRGVGLDTERPIFIVGLPRSGTTLTEQILASHSQVYGAGELNYLRETFEALPQVYGGGTSLECLGKMDQRARPLAEWHLARLAELDARALRVADKMPVKSAASVPKRIAIAAPRDTAPISARAV